ncbi:hypothetical protein EW026_g8422 [Hermanssonia centrifuga]|uniref:Uncharacterized protein n=1 Tax=Hermanssonia centrifuga TaxID=98765 RepID=A0A4S4K443_9APHY|nr:hypothetical protein EW026_g8422 [Hermanssonia centrifuga]
MDTLPLEIHSQIFQLACIDAGSTARSLALVSRYVREVAEPFLYQSLAVAGLSSMTEFLNRLERVPAHLRRVRQLFLSDWTQKQVQQKTIPSDDADMDRYDLEKSIIIRILDLVAPTLESFAFLVSCPFNSTQLIGHLFSLKSSHLRHLSIHGFYPFPHSLNALPHLEHLHLSGNRNPHGLLQTGGLEAACPRLTHLRISGLVSAPSFAQELEDALLPAPHDTTKSCFRASLPSSVRQVAVQLGPAPAKSRRYSSAVAQHEKMTERLMGLSQCADSLPVRYRLMHDNEDVYETMRNSWADGSNDVE